MSETRLRGDGLLVEDFVLAQPALESLRNDVEHHDFRFVHANKLDKAWRLRDGHPLRGASAYYDPEGLFASKVPVYPTATPLDALIDAIRALASDHAAIVGREGVEWAGMYLSSWIYPAGTALSLHRDGVRYSGSFAFFLHPQWRSHWGGELVVCAPRAGGDDVEPSIADEEEDRLDDGSGIATCITPLPNRAVLLGPNRPHRVARVDANAGTRVRVSVAGFFLRFP